MATQTTRGCVIATYGKESLFQADNGEAPYLISANRKAGKAVCGDLVEVDCERRIAKIEGRDSEYIRPDFRHRPKVIAANIDTLIWLTSHSPPNDELIAARALIVARLQNLSLVIIQSKTDSMPSEPPEHLSSTQSFAEDCDIPWFPISTLNGDGLSPLLQSIEGKNALIVGQSGVGKSTLVAKLTGDQQIKTQSVSDATGHGRHTTTTAQQYIAKSHQLTLIDAPGMRDIGLWQMPEQTLLAALPEITNVAQNCRFHNCRHDQEPDCAVKVALENGEIPELLYRAYQDAVAKELLS